MARGSDMPHFDGAEDPEIVLYEQDKHRSVSKANGKGFCGGLAGPHWQSHHIICLTAMDGWTEMPESVLETLEPSLYLTPWNINDAPNMIGLPMRAWYRKSYGEDKIYTPTNIPSHNNDHNTKGGYLHEVKAHLKKHVWDKFDPKNKTHEQNAETIQGQLKSTSRLFQNLLLRRGARNGGTLYSWEHRLDPGQENSWYYPFSMARVPKKRRPGMSATDLRFLFQSL